MANSAQYPDCLPPLTYSVADAAKTASLGRTTLYKLISTGKLPVIKVGGRTLIRHDDLNALLSSPPANDNRPPANLSAEEDWKERVRASARRRLGSSQ